MVAPDHDPVLTGTARPRVKTPPPGPRSRQWVERIGRVEASGIDTRAGGASPIVWQAARGANVLDVDGNLFLDLTSGFGVAALGHRNPVIEAAVDAQRALLVHGLGDLQAHVRRIELAERLSSLAPWTESRVYFAISGSDAVEIALKTACLATGRSAVLAFDGSYHGTTLGSLAATGRRNFRRPFAAQLNPAVRFLPYGTEIDRLEATLLGPDPVGAVVVEPILGRGGVRHPPPGWLAELRHLTQRTGTLLVFDELLTGGGRTGPFFAGSGHGVVPDLICCGKALSGGYPLAAVLGRADLLEVWPDSGEALHTATFLAHPVACAAALSAVELLCSCEVAGFFSARSREFAAGLEELGARHERIVVRGTGLLWGLDLGAPGAAVAASHALLREGLLTLPSGLQGEVLELLPPYTITADQVAAALEILARVLVDSA